MILLQDRCLAIKLVLHCSLVRNKTVLHVVYTETSARSQTFVKRVVETLLLMHQPVSEVVALLVDSCVDSLACFCDVRLLIHILAVLQVASCALRSCRRRSRLGASLHPV